MNICLNKTLWDKLAQRFNLHHDSEELLHPDSAVNLYVGWPTFTDYINKQSSPTNKKALKILDYGCGSGWYCKRLHEMGHKVTGVDISSVMLELARTHNPAEVELLDVDNFDQLVENKKNHESFDAVVAIHSFDWINELDETITKLTKLLKKQGIFIFGVFPKVHVIDSIKIGDLFEDFDDSDNPSFGYANFDGVRVPTYVRNVDYYDGLFTGLGFTRELEVYPPYPKEFLEKYKWTGSMQPEMLIMVFRKSH